MDKILFWYFKQLAQRTKSYSVVHCGDKNFSFILSIGTTLSTIRNNFKIKYRKIFFLPQQLTLHPYNFYNILILAFVYYIIFYNALILKVSQFVKNVPNFFIDTRTLLKCSNMYLCLENIFY
jgi:hypothetical protein